MTWCLSQHALERAQDRFGCVNFAVAAAEAMSRGEGKRVKRAGSVFHPGQGRYEVRANGRTVCCVVDEQTRTIITVHAKNRSISKKRAEKMIRKRRKQRG